MPASTRPARTYAPPARRRADQLLLLSELFPPAVGGSAVLFHGIYSRVTDAHVAVLADGPADQPPGRDGTMTVAHAPLATRGWGILDRTALAHHIGVARRIRAMFRGKTGVVHCARALPEGLAALISRLLGGPRYVCWAHGEDLTTALGSREYTVLTRLVYRFASAALANSRNTATLLNRLGVPDVKIRIVHPAVDADRFHPGVDGSAIRQRFAGKHDLVLLSVGRLQRRKGHDVSIRAVAALEHECPGLRYVIAGDGEERARLEGLVRELGVEDRVTFAGIVADEDLPAYYAACDVFLLPNRIDDGDIEGFGIVFLEAAATGKPVIGGDSGGVPEAVERDQTGLLVDGARVDAVAGAIRELASSEHLRRRLGLAGRVRAREAFSWQRAARIVADLQASLVTR